MLQSPAFRRQFWRLQSQRAQVNELLNVRSSTFRPKHDIEGVRLRNTRPTSLCAVTTIVVVNSIILASQERSAETVQPTPTAG